MRKHKVAVIDREGRDKGKHFLILEMPAMRAEKWAAKALLALGRAGVEISDETMQAGAAAVLGAGLSAFKQMRFEDAEPLLDEMMSCISVVPDPARKDPVSSLPLSRPIMTDDDIEEPGTLLFLRGEVIEVHTGFSVTAALSSLGAAAKTSKPRSTRTSRSSRAR